MRQIRSARLSILGIFLSSLSAPWLQVDGHNDCLEAHNYYRRLHGVPELVHDDELASFAQSWADRLAPSGRLEHSKNPNYGENLAWNSWTMSDCEQMVQMWYNEIDGYDFHRPGFSPGSGHFTQLIWKDTQRVGCAAAIGNGITLVCEYYPPGNYMGNFPENVTPPTRSQQGRKKADLTSRLVDKFRGPLQNHLWLNFIRSVPRPLIASRILSSDESRLSQCQGR